MWILFCCCWLAAAGVPHGESRGLFPDVFNLAATSRITVNATCGEAGPEIYCKLVEHVLLSGKSQQCSACDAAESHPIVNAIDGSDRWWQSPSLQNGKQYEWVTITLDLKQVYQVAYVIVKAGASPRPGNWILERSLDGLVYQPWQYYALTDAECWEAYGIRPSAGQPHYASDEEVICTSFYSKLNPLEDGEIHTSLVNGRPGVDGPSRKLMDFTRARYVRLRLQRIRTLHADLKTNDVDRIDKTVTRRYFYTIKDISVGGQCACSGHAATCSADPPTGKLQCQCEHNTCGENCDRCCPLHNQQPWLHGTADSAAVCEKCECYGHSDSCHYEHHAALQQLSLNSEGKYSGGGVCDQCKHHTSGVNCDRCEDGYYRPLYVPRNHTRPCRKCQCAGIGMTGDCVRDDSHVTEAMKPGRFVISSFHYCSGLPGTCFCKAGFAGEQCDRCDVGYRNYPLCEPCPCHSAGTVGSATCEGECLCKPRVEGARCDRCQPGSYHLSAANLEGCSRCFCFGLTDECREADWGVRVIQSLADWKVTDLGGTRVVKPTPEDDNMVIANDDVSQLSSYYWLAPRDYLGKKLYSYGSDLQFTLSYVVARGDTSGTYTESADVVLEGNGVQIGCKWGSRPEMDAVAISVPLREQGWFLLDAPAATVGREAFTLVLHNLTRLLIRAKFHTDQIEGRLHSIGMQVAEEGAKSLKRTESLEKCVCPVGYAGLSCELCAPGFRSASAFGVRHRCERCDCHNHAESCDNGLCEACLHHTGGPRCERCLRGFYGDARAGTADDCRPCACPLLDPANNFSPSCTADPAADYTCDRCAPGHEGSKCERCADGFFGNPQVAGGRCRQCECGGNADTCDGLTGQCLRCRANTAGWRCSECLPDHYGSPEQHLCQPCLCHPKGSESAQCHLSSGQCACRPNFVGRTCSRCAVGHGHVESGCLPCRCDRTGSVTESCDPVSGRCSCKAGVFGISCDSCLEGYYGFSSHGCQACNCDPSGSASAQCADGDGQCPCKRHVTTRTCSRCEDGYWHLQSGRGCEECRCNRTGASAAVCDQRSGQCHCKPGVGGVACDSCLLGFFRLAAQGCQRCDPCHKPGHVCDPDTGRCVCPPNTRGQRCHKCAPNTWGYDPVKGCKPCDCSVRGSNRTGCEAETGSCFCLEGFQGARCDKCRPGFYDFPHCRRCDCSVDGTSHCQDATCQCSDGGECACKELVTGPKCDSCANRAFGLSFDNPKGCYECFCFGKTNTCSQANAQWTQVKIPARDVFMEGGPTDLPTILGFQVIPEDLVDKRIGLPPFLDKPLYWSLPKEYLGDKVLSYNGHLQFRAESRGGAPAPLRRHPLVLLQGHQRLLLAHSPPAAPRRMPYRLRMHEDEWKMYDNPLMPVTKSVLAVALQNLQYILIKASDGADAKYARLDEVSLDVASAVVASAELAKGVEMCRCPRQYAGLSCQDPAPGYYRMRKPDYLNSKDILDLVGWAEPCSCSNRTNICDKESGVCVNCGGNTMGEHCEQCERGFYGEPSLGPCRPCACPHPDRSFSDTCVPDASDYICVNCRQGYTGRHCETCAPGFARAEGIECAACQCNPYGSLGRECDAATGQCRCRDGVRGRDCSGCGDGFVLTEYGCKSCEDECTGILLKELYEMQWMVDSTNFTDLPRLPWGYLKKILHEEQRLRVLVNEYRRNISLGKDLIDNFSFYLDLETQADMLLVKAKDDVSRAIVLSVDAKGTLDAAEKLFTELNKIWRNIKDLASELESRGPSTAAVSVQRALAEAERILREIQAQDFGADREGAERELRRAENMLNNVKKLTLDRVHVDELKRRLDRLDGLLAHFGTSVAEGVRKPAQRAAEAARIGEGRRREVLGILNDISAFLESSNLTVKEAAELLDLANSDLVDAAVQLEYLPRLVRDAANATDRLDERRSILAQLGALYREQYVIPARRHADALQQQSLRLADLFRATQELSAFPLQAAKAYQSIVDAIRAAEVAAREAASAADHAHRQAAAGDALTRQATSARARSLQLLAAAHKLNDEEVPELEEQTRQRKEELSELSAALSSAEKSHALLRRELDALPAGLGSSLGATASQSDSARDRADAAHGKAKRLSQRLEVELQPRFDSVRTVGGLDNLTRSIQQAREDGRRAARLAEGAVASSGRVRKQHELAQLNLKALRDKILLARQKASSIRVGLTSDAAGRCSRSFEAQVQPSITSNVVLHFATRSTAPDSLLFYIGSSSEEDFMALEMINRKIRFLWNAGGGTQVIAHNMTIETNTEQFLKNSQWFKIEANRIGNIGTLSVQRTPDGQRADPFEVSGASPVGYTKMDLDASADFFIGEFPQEYLPPEELQASSFSGCLYEALLDGRPIGLWNFRANRGCGGCKEGATEDIDITAFEFQGRSSYAIVPQIPYYKKSELYTVLSFRTLNEDALLFLSCNLQTGQYISIELKDGHVVYQLELDDRARVSLRTAEKYNTGRWTRVEASRDKFEAQMLVEEEHLQERLPHHGSSAVDLRGSPLFYGGVAPNFTQASFPSVTFRPLFGCLKDLQMDSTPIDLSRGSFYGMAVGCSGRPTRAAAFRGLGHLQLDGQPLLADSSFSFSFLSVRRDALLLLSTFGDHAQDFYSVALRDGRVVATLGDGVTLASDDAFGTDAFHTVSVVRKHRRLLLRVDDEEEAEFRLPKGAKDITSPKSGGLYLGGVGEGVSVSDMAASEQPLVGVIQDVIFNDRLLRFDNAVSHRGVDFGSPDIDNLAAAVPQREALRRPPAPEELALHTGHAHFTH